MIPKFIYDRNEAKREAHQEQVQNMNEYDKLKQEGKL